MPSWGMSDISSGVRPCGFTLFLIDSLQMALFTGISFTYKECTFVFIFWYIWQYLPSDTVVKNLPVQGTQRHGFDPWVGKIPWSRKWQPTPLSLPEKSHGERSLGSQGVGHDWAAEHSDTHIRGVSNQGFARANMCSFSLTSYYWSIHSKEFLYKWWWLCIESPYLFTYWALDKNFLNLNRVIKQRLCEKRPRKGDVL